MKPLPIIILVVIFASSSQAQFSFAPINVPGTIATQARGINGGGEIVGFYKTIACGDFSVSVPDCATKGFKYVNGGFVKLMVPNSTSTAITGVNDNGDLVGFFTRSDGTKHGFLWLHTNVVKTLDYPGTSFTTVPMAINKAGAVVGGLWSINSLGTFPEGGWVWKNGAFSNMTLGTAGCYRCTSVNGVSNNGIIVGEAFRNDFWTGWLKESTDDDFFLYRSGDTRATGVNKITDIVGWGTSVSGFFAKHIEWNEGANDGVEVQPSFISVSYPGAGGTFPFALNDGRAIVGTYFDSSGRQHGFLATPTF